MLVEEVIVYESPKSFYLSIGLWSSYSGVFVDDIQFLKHYLKTMKMSWFLMVCCKFQPIIREKFLYGNASAQKPFVGSSHKICKSSGSFVRDNFCLCNSRCIIYQSSPVFLFLRILSLDVLLFVHVDVYHFSCHFFLITYDFLSQNVWFQIPVWVFLRVFFLLWHSSWNSIRDWLS